VYRRFHVRAACVPTALRKPRLLEKTQRLDAASRVMLIGKRPPAGLCRPELADTQRFVETEALSLDDRRRLVKHIIQYLGWLMRRRIRIGTTTPDDICLRLAELALCRSVPECIHAYTAIRRLYRLRGLFDPSESELVRRALSAIRLKSNVTPRPQPQLKALQALIATCDDSLRGQRDAVVLLLLFAGVKPALIVRLRWQNVSFVPDGAELRDGDRNRSLDCGNGATCPVNAMRSLRVLHNGHGFVVRSLRDATRGIGIAQLWVILRDRCESARLLRRTLVTLRRHFLHAIGEFGYDDTTYRSLAEFQRSETGRKYNLSRSPQGRSRHYRSRTIRKTRNFPGHRQ
jgi:hypothetical protein